MSSEPIQLKSVLKKHGQVIIEDIPALMFCKPRLLPLKSFTLEKLEKTHQEAQQVQEQNRKE